MKTKLVLPCIRHFMRKRVVLLDDEVHLTGKISQVFLHPTKGRVLGFAVHVAGQPIPMLIAFKYLLCTQAAPVADQVAALTDAFSIVEEFGIGATTYQDLLGARVLTEDGRHCGQIEEIYFGEEGLQTIYQVRKTGWRGLFRKFYFIHGNDGHFYSYCHRRLIFACGATRFKSLAAAVEGWLSAPLISDGAETLPAPPPQSNNTHKMGAAA
ncbi:MAG: hypothetical protein U0Y68_27300 [Blastocatellia bacterium]